MTTHTDTSNRAECPVCAPIIAAAKSASAENDRQMLAKNRNSAAYKRARRELHAASRVAVATARDHFAHL